MYCSNCGTRLDEGARICSNCGYQVQGYFDAEAYQQYKQNTINNLEVNREEILRKLDKALPIYQFIVEKDCIIQNLREKERRQRAKKAKNGGAVVLGILLGVILAIVMYVLSLQNAFDGLLVSIVIWLPMVLMILLNNKIKGDAVRKTEREINETQLEIQRYIKANNIPELYYLPERYRYFIAAQYIRECIANQRARDLSDALNLYEEQMYRWKMENYQYHLYVQNMQNRLSKIMVIF